MASPSDDPVLMRALVDAAPDAYVVIDQRGVIILVNVQAERLFGYPRAELIGKKIEALLPERYRGAHLGHRDGFFADPRVRPMGADLDLYALRQDGSEFPVEISLSPIRTASGVYASAAIRDATARRKREGKFRGLLEAAPDAMVIMDRAGKIVLVNRQAEAIFGYPRAELLGQTIELLIPERYHARHPGHRDAYFAAPRARPMGANLELWARRKDGSEFPVEISLSPLETEDGTLVSSAIRDISKKKEAEAVERQQFVTKRLVRRMLRDAATGTTNNLMRRRLGRDMAKEANGTEIRQFLDAFGAMGLGALDVESVAEDRYTVRGVDLLEVTPGAPAPTCVLALGFLEGAVEHVSGREALGTELSCQSRGQSHCVFVIQSRDATAAARKP